MMVATIVTGVVAGLVGGFVGYLIRYIQGKVNADTTEVQAKR
jgi:uncharacterized membrane-anchored protein